MLEAKNIHYYAHDGAHILKGVDVNIKKGDVLAVVGPSGSGKSSLINSLSMLIPPSSGEIYLDGQKIDIFAPLPVETRIKIGMVFQEYTLFPHLTLLENVSITPIKKKGLSKEEAEKKAIESLRRVGLGEKYLSYPGELSSGELQRGEIARALAMDSEVIFLDDPTSALNLIGEREVESVIRELSAGDATLMLATSSLNLAKNVADYVMLLVNGEVYEYGTTKEIFENPKRSYTKEFVNGLKSLKIDIQSKDHDFIHSFSEIDLFCYYYKLHQNTVNHILSAIEETTSILFRVLDNPQIRLTISSDSENNMTITFLYNGDVYDIRDTKDLISLAIIEVAAEISEFAPIDKEPYRNKLVFKIK